MLILNKSLSFTGFQPSANFMFLTFDPSNRRLCLWLNINVTVDYWVVTSLLRMGNLRGKYSNTGTLQLIASVAFPPALAQPWQECVGSSADVRANRYL